MGHADDALWEVDVEVRSALDSSNGAASDGEALSEAHDTVTENSTTVRQPGGPAAARILERAILWLFPGRIALASSFGADSAVLLHMVSRIAPHTPVLFLDTGKLFTETLEYRSKLIATLGLTDVRSVAPLQQRIADDDPSGFLWSVEPDHCCTLRKVQPLSLALEGFDAWVTGRKRVQAATRSLLPVFERDGARVKVNPLAGWSAAHVANYMAQHDLPRHPLVAQGYSSIGCATCTTPTKPGEPARAGRWRSHAKTECGIHDRLVAPNNQVGRFSLADAANAG